MKRKFLALILLIFTIQYLEATNYFVSNNGNDSDNGKSPEKAWKTIERVNERNLKPGDTVFFHRGSIFMGELLIQYSGEENNPIVFTAYGEGKKPVLKGSETLTGFVKTKGNIYSAKVSHDIKNLYHENKSMILARYPDKGFLTMDGGGPDYLIDEDNSFSADDLEGVGIIIRPLNWIYERRTVTGVENNRISFDSPLFETSTHQTVCKNNWGYYLQNSMQFLDNDGEWYYNSDDQKIYIYSSKPLPANYSVEASYLNTAVLLEKGVSYVTLNNLRLTKFHNNGIKAPGNNINVEVKNSTIDNIFEIAVDGGLHASHFYLRGNEIHDIYGRAVSFLEARNCRVEQNRIQNIGIIAGYGISGLNGGTGILFSNRERVPAGERINSSDNYIGYNLIDSTGYNSIRFDGINSICEYNNVSNALLTLNDGSVIYCWGRDTLFTRDNIIRNNIVRHAHGNTEGTPVDHKMNNGIYLDNRANHVQVYNNYIEGVGSGIHVNDGSFGNVLNNNTLYRNKVGVSFAEFSKNNEVYCEDNTCTNNILFNTYNLGHTLSLKHTYEPDFYPGIIDSNVYVSPNEKYHIKKETMEEGCKIIREYTFDAWSDAVEHDQNSRYVESTFGTKSIAFVNGKNKIREFDLDENLKYTDLEGKSVSGKVIVEPFTAKILMYTFE